MADPVPGAASVEAYIASASEFARPICTKLREIVRKAAPKLEEGIKWRSPNYKGNGLVCSIGAFKEHVNVGFFLGALLDDPAGLLEGTGKRGRHVKLRPGREIDSPALARLIETAYDDIRERL